MVILWKFREIHFMAVVVADLKMVVLRWNKNISLVNCKKIPAWWLVAAAAWLKFFLSLFFVLIKTWNIVFLLLPLKPFYLPWYQLGRISNYKPEKTFVLTFKPFTGETHTNQTQSTNQNIRLMRWKWRSDAIMWQYQFCIVAHILLYIHFISQNV